jgi:hypothetical protein
MTDARQDRLGRALRENLKRRKSQARERDKERDRQRGGEGDGQRDDIHRDNMTAAAPSKHHEDALDDDTGSGGDR